MFRISSPNMFHDLCCRLEGSRLYSVVWLLEPCSAASNNKLMLVLLG